MQSCIYLTHIEMYRDVPPLSALMEPLYSVNSFTVALDPPADDYVAQIMVFLPNIRELTIHCHEIVLQYFKVFTRSVFSSNSSCNICSFVKLLVFFLRMNKEVIHMYNHK